MKSKHSFIGPRNAQIISLNNALFEVWLSDYELSNDLSNEQLLKSILELLSLQQRCKHFFIFAPYTANNGD